MKLIVYSEEMTGKGVAPPTLAVGCMHLKSIAGGAGWQKEHVLINYKNNESKETNYILFDICK